MSTLVLCTSVTFVDKLKEVLLDQQKAGEEVVIGTDDPKVHFSQDEILKKHKIKWLDGRHSMFQVGKEFNQTLKCINEWSEGFLNSKNLSSAFQWGEHPEGGKTSQKILEMLILAESLKRIFKAHGVNQIILIGILSEKWKEILIRQMAVESGFAYRRESKTNRRSIKSIIYKQFKAIRKVVGNLRISWGKIFSGKGTLLRDADVVFQLNNPHKKHVQNTIPLMEEFSSRGFKTAALLWDSEELSPVFRNNNLLAVPLLAYLNLSDWCLAVIWMGFLRLKFPFAAKSLSRELKKSRTTALDQPIAEVVRLFIKRRGFRRILYARALFKFFKFNKPLAIRLWGGTEISDGFIMSRSIPRNLNSVTFLNPVGISPIHPFNSRKRDISILFVFGDYHRKIELANGYSEKQLQFMGGSRFAKLNNQVQSVTVIESRKHLKIELGYQLYVFFDLIKIVKGRISLDEYYTRISRILEFARRNPTIAIILKPHPGDSNEFADKWIASESLSNIYAIDRKELPFHAINASDLLITKFSTLGIEAMMLQRPVVSLILDDEQGWESVFGNGVPYYYSTEDLFKEIEFFAQNNRSFLEWKAQSLLRQNNFLRNFLADDSGNSMKLMASSIEERFVKANEN